MDTTTLQSVYDSSPLPIIPQFQDRREEMLQELAAIKTAYNKNNADARELIWLVSNVNLPNTGAFCTPEMKNLVGKGRSYIAKIEHPQTHEIYGQIINLGEQMLGIQNDIYERMNKVCEYYHVPVTTSTAKNIAAVEKLLGIAAKEVEKAEKPKEVEKPKETAEFPWVVVLLACIVILLALMLGVVIGK